MSKVAKATLGLMIVTLLSKVLGFGRELILSSIYGATSYSDAYIVAMNIPIVLFESVGVALATTFIPLYYESEKIGNGEEVKFTNNVINIILIISFIIGLLGCIFAKQLVNLFAIGFKEDVLYMTIKFTRIMIWSVLFIGITSIMSSILQIKGKFIVPGLIGIPFSLIIMLSIVLSDRINIYILPIGTLIAVLSKCLFQIPFVYKYGYRYKPIIKINDKYIKKMIWLVGPVFIGVAVNQINTVVDRTLASTLVEGSISALNYANRLNTFVIGLFILSIGSVVYPLLSRLSVDNNNEKYISTIVKSINSVILLVIPVSVGAIVLSKPIVSLLFQRGAFDSKATNMTSIALTFYSIGMVAFGLRDILGKIFYSIQDTKTPMINGAITMFLNIILNLVLVKFMGHGGLALATSLSSIICIILLFRSLKNKIGYFGQDKIIKTTIKSLISAIIMGIGTNYMYIELNGLLGMGFISKAISLFGSIGIGCIIYCILIVILKVNEIEIILKSCNKLISKYRNNR